MASDIHDNISLGTLPQFVVQSSTQAGPIQGWHPKITPYRLSIILTTLCLGTVKAVLTYQGRTIAPITLEWIMSVVLLLFFQITSDYDSDQQAPPGMSWFFTFDCLNIVWKFLALFSIRRPSYASDEVDSIPSRDPSHPPITVHRIMVSLVTLFLGMSKAWLGYLGSESSTAVTWLDWLLWTVIMTGFYIIGLYEFNSANVWAPFFMHDRASHIVFFNWTILALLVIISTSLIVFMCVAGLWATWYLRAFHNIFSSSPNLLGYFFEMCYNIFFSSFLVMVLFVMTRMLVFVVGYNLPRAVTNLPLQIYRGVWRWIWSERSQPGRLRELFGEHFRRILAHVILHLLGVAVCVAISGSFLGITTMMYTSPSRKELGVDLVMSIARVFVAIMGIAGIALVIPILMILHNMIRPFYSYRRPYPQAFYDSLLNFS